MGRLKKNLGLFDVFAISTGAMISSGLFLLPGLAAAQTGLSVPLAYLVAGVLMIPAMLSKAELATAMPRAGGTYYFLDRAMGPLIGTIGGIGTWISLILKSGFALIGMGAYIALFIDVPIIGVALILTVLLCFANIVGAKESSGLQRLLVTILLAVVGGFLLVGLEGTALGDAVIHREQAFLLDGMNGFLATVGLVFVSYAGLTKVASVAEEVKNPDRNIPLGMMLSLGVATLTYTACVGVMALVIPPERLHSDLAPMATATEILAGDWARPAVLLIVVAATAAFVSTANAGILSASRFPFAMARDRLLPSKFAIVGAAGTPLVGIVATSLLIGGVIVLLDVTTVAKLASGLKLLLFSLVNLCVIVMREGRLDYYRPGFKSPLYPGIQIAGMLVPLWLIAEMGLVAMSFTAGLVVVGGLWYLGYARGRVARRGAIFHVFERLGNHRWDGLDHELRRILHEKGPHPADPLGATLGDAEAIEVDTDSFADVAAAAAARFADRTGLPADDLAEAFIAETRIGMMPVVDSAAFPHHQYLGVERPEIVVVRTPGGVDLRLDPDEAHVAPERPLSTFIFLLSPDGNAASHYRILAHIAGRFEEALAEALKAPEEGAEVIDLTALRVLRGSDQPQPPKSPARAES